MKSILKVFFITTMIYLPLIANPFATQLITILTDDSEPGIDRGEVDTNGNLLKLGTTSKDVYVHLLQQESAIVVNSSVLHHLMTFLTKKNDNPLKLNPKPTITPDDFITRQVTDDLFIIVPQKYIQSRPNYQALKKLDLKKMNSPYTAKELTVGLKLQGTLVKNNDFLRPAFYKSKDTYKEKWLDLTPLVLKDEQGTSIINRKVSGSWISEQLIKHLPDIFIPLSVYQKLGIENLAPTSVIIAYGHGSKSTSINREIKDLQKNYGSPAQDEINRLLELKKKGVKALMGGQIAGLNADDFGDLVGYIVKNISTPLLFFNTCFGSEVNVEAALRALAQKEKQELQDLKVPHIMISGAISNAPAYNKVEAITLESQTETATTTSNGKPIKDEITYTLLDLNKKPIKTLHFTVNYDKNGNPINQPPVFPDRPTVVGKPLYKNFMETLNSGNNVSDQLFINALDSIYTLYGDVSSYNNIPIIKYPNEDWRPLHLPDKVIIVSPEFVEKNKNQTSVDISSAFAKQKNVYPRVILLSALSVPFEIAISGSDLTLLPAWISYAHGDAIHYIKKLSAPASQLSAIIQNFFAISDLEDNKIFLINELEGLNDLSVLNANNQKITLNNVIIMNKAPDKNDPNYRLIIKFTYNNTDWQANTVNVSETTTKIKKDSSNTLKDEWTDLLKLTPTQIQSPTTKTIQPTQQTQKPTTSTKDLEKKAHDAVLDFARACVAIATNS